MAWFQLHTMGVCRPCREIMRLANVRTDSQLHCSCWRQSYSYSIQNALSLMMETDV